MNGAKTVLRQVGYEQRSYWRNRSAAAFTFGFPLLFLVIFTAINGNDKVDVGGGIVRFAQYYVPSIAAFGIISACYTNLAFVISIRRENGLLKRVRATPLAPSAYLGGVAGNAIVVCLVITTLTTGLGLLVYGVTFPGRYLALVVTVAVGAFCFSALGVAVSTFVPNEDAAPAIINFIVFPLLFISGTFGQIDPSSGLSKIANVFPVRHLGEQMVEDFNPFGHGPGLIAVHIGALLLWGVVGIAVSLRRFRWAPRTG